MVGNDKYFLGVPAVEVLATSTTGEEIIGDITLYDLVSLLEFPLASLSDTDGAARSSVITDPPSDLQLDWDMSSISADSVEIVLALVVGETEGFEDVAILDEVPNTGSYLIPSTALEEFDLDGSYVFFKVRIRPCQILCFVARLLAAACSARHLSRTFYCPCSTEINHRISVVTKYAVGHPWIFWRYRMKWFIGW